MKFKYTYIIKTKKGEFYCDKTNDLNKRIEEHKKEKSPKWFGQYTNRRVFEVIKIFNNDYEKNIKRIGIKNLLKLISDDISDSYIFI